MRKKSPYRMHAENWIKKIKDFTGFNLYLLLLLSVLGQLPLSRAGWLSSPAEPAAIIQFSPTKLPCATGYSEVQWERLTIR